MKLYRVACLRPVEHGKRTCYVTTFAVMATSHADACERLRKSDSAPVTACDMIAKVYDEGIIGCDAFVLTRDERAQRIAGAEYHHNGAEG